MEGRATGSEGYQRAADYVVRQFQQLSIEPAGTNGHFQPVQFEDRLIDEAQSQLALSRSGKTTPLRFGNDLLLFPFGQTGQAIDAEMVFAGYGLTIPEYRHDDFSTLNVKGKIVVFVDGAPAAVPSTVAAHYSSVEQRARNFERLGAIGALNLVNPRLEEIPWARLAMMRGQFSRGMELADPTMVAGATFRVAGIVSPESTPTLLGVSKERVAEILRLDAERKPLPKFVVPGRLRGVVVYRRSSVTSNNVVGVLRGSEDKLKDEYVVLSAHLDHVGVSDPIDGDSIYNGAMDNASGVATLLAVARLLRETGERPRRSLLLLACTGEEMGLLGSKYFANRPTVPVTNMVANINLDMFLPIIPMRMVRGYGVNESDLAEHLGAAAKEVGIAIQDDPEPERNIFIRSDQYSFIKRGVPALFLSAGWLPGSPEDIKMKEWFSSRYHAPSDDLDQSVDIEAADRFNRLMSRLAVRIANAHRAPQWRAKSFFKTFVPTGDRSR
jgi:hypothetical protein